MSAAGPILLVGCGKMGGAMAAGWLAAGRQVVVVEPNAPPPPGVALAVTDAAALPADLAPAAVVLAVKPQEAARVLPFYARFATASVFVSIMAGKTVANMQALLGTGARVVRAMPNTPAAIGRGITVCCAGPGVAADQRDLADALLKAVGQVEWVDDEALIDPVTAVSGGGPAYVFLLVEMLAQAAVAEGIPEALAQRLARATVAGSGALLDASAEVPAATLRQNVTSPGGTTAEALAVLMDDAAWPALMRRAIAAARARSRALSA